MRVTIQQAIKLLNKGHVTAIPTETVYGLAAALNHPQAIQQIFHLKARPSNNPLIIHLSNASEVRQYAKDLPPHFNTLAQAFWPGAMTLVIPIIPETIPAEVRAHLPTAAFRIPNHPSTLELIRQTGPLVMPSANLSGRPSSTQPEHVETDFGSQFPVLDGGKSANGLESTIMIFNEGQWQIIRLGALSAEVFTPILGYCPSIAQLKNNARPICPGQQYRHYAPKTRLFLTKTFSEGYQGVVIGFSDRTYPQHCRVFSLSELSNPKQAANNLYSVLRQLDIEEIEEAHVDIDIPTQGLWATILERLTKAAQVNIKQ